MSGHLAEEAIRLGAVPMSDTQYDTELSRTVKGYAYTVRILATPEETLSFINQLDGLYGPAEPVREQRSQTAQPAQQGTPNCPKHGTPMASSKFGGFYCREKDPSTEKGFCIEKVK